MEQMSSARAEATIVGNVGRDPELRFTQSGKAFCTFSVAVTERVKQGDDWEDGDTSWFNIKTWGYVAEDVAERVQKGQRVIVYGRLKIESWEGQDGVERRDTTITANTVGIVPRAPKNDGPPQRARAAAIPEEPPF